VKHFSALNTVGIFCNSVVLEFSCVSVCGVQNDDDNPSPHIFRNNSALQFPMGKSGESTEA